MITQSAIKINGKIYTGDTHREIIFDLVSNKKVSLPLEGEQGFINNSGKFLSREEAAAEALRCKQIEKLNYCTTRLFSEDLLQFGTFNFRILTNGSKQQGGFWNRMIMKIFSFAH